MDAETALVAQPVTNNDSFGATHIIITIEKRWQKRPLHASCCPPVARGCRRQYAKGDDSLEHFNKLHDDEAAWRLEMSPFLPGGDRKTAREAVAQVLKTKHMTELEQSLRLSDSFALNEGEFTPFHQSRNKFVHDDDLKTTFQSQRRLQNNMYDEYGVEKVLVCDILKNRPADQAGGCRNHAIE